MMSTSFQAAMQSLDALYAPVERRVAQIPHDMLCWNKQKRQKQPAQSLMA
jgi:hypothetical protein